MALIVEGPSDKILLESQAPWFNNIGLDVVIRIAGGKKEMCKSAGKFHRVETLQGTQKVVFLPDQDGDPCVTFTRQRVGMDRCPCAITVVLKRELEAWILADGRALASVTAREYRPAGQTDSILDPKAELGTLLERTLGYRPTAVEMAGLIAKRFSLVRAARYNTSARRFVQEIKRLSGR